MAGTLLNDDEINGLLSDYPAWSFDGQALTRSYQFPSFDEAFAFMSDVATVSASQNHHPDWRNCYGRIDVTIVDHDAGGVSDRDHRWVTAVELLNPLEG